MQTIFLPWRGEFGMMLMKWVRAVHGHPSNNKIVCITKGSEALFPSAAGFIYDWEPVKDNQRNNKLLRSKENYQYLTSLSARLTNNYPAATFVYPQFDGPRPHREDRQHNFFPIPKVTRGLQVDIVVGPRYREHGSARNFEHWQEIILKFNQWGLSVGAIGAAETSVPNLNGLVYRSWDYDYLDAGIEMLRTCKLAVMSCSGPAHLAVLCGTPLKVIYDKPKMAVDGKGRWYMEDMQNFATVHCEPIVHGWRDPEMIYTAVLNYLHRAK